MAKEHFQEHNGCQPRSDHSRVVDERPLTCTKTTVQSNSLRRPCDHLALHDAPCTSSNHSDDNLEVEAAVQVLLREIGEDTEREGLQKTPTRVANAFRAATRGMQESPSAILQSALFSEEGSEGASGQGGGSGGLVLVQDIECFSTCAGCLLPLRVCCHVAYVPQGNRVVGISKLPRAALSVARRLQTPELFAEELKEAVRAAFDPSGVAVVVEAMHLVNLEHAVTGIRQPSRGCSGPPWTNGHVSDDGHTDGFAASKEQDESQLGGCTCDGRRGLDYNVGGWAVAGTPGHCVVVTCCGSFDESHRLDELFLMLRLKRELLVTKRNQKTSSSADALNVGECETVGENSLFCIEQRSKANHSERLQENGASPKLSEDQKGIPAELLTFPFLPAALENNPASHAEKEAVRAADVIVASCSHPRVCSRDTQGVPLENGGREMPERPLQLGQTAERYVAYLMAATSGYKLTLEWLQLMAKNLAGVLLQEPFGSGTYVDRNGACAAAKGETNGLRLTHSAGGTCQGARFTADEGEVWYSRLPVSSLCEHHLLPFFGQAHIWYKGSPREGSTGATENYPMCNGYVNGDFKFSDTQTEYQGASGLRAEIEPMLLICIVLMYSRRLQVQERLTKEIAEGVDLLSGGHGAMVVIEASHLCMSVRGVERPGASTASLSTLGCFSVNAKLRSLCLERMQTPS